MLLLEAAEMTMLAKVPARSRDYNDYGRHRDQYNVQFSYHEYCPAAPNLSCRSSLRGLWCLGLWIQVV